MANQYDQEMRMLERRRQIAEALRASGNEALPASIDTGRFHAAVSPWEHANRATQQLVGAYMERRANKDEKSLTERQRQAQVNWMRGLEGAQTPNELQPVAVSGKLMEADSAPISGLELDPNMPLDQRQPVGLQDQMANRAKYLRGYSDTKSTVDSSDRQRLLAHYMKGGEVGGVPEALGMAGLQRELLPPVSEPFTLGQGDTRYGPKGQVIARGEDKTFAPTDTATDDMREYAAAQAAGYKGTLQEWILEQKRAGASSTNVNLPPQQNAEGQAVGKGFGEMFNESQAAGVEANAKIATYNRMKQLMEGVNTGKLAPTMAQIAAVGESFGIKLDETLDQKQALESLSNELALQMRNPSGGAGMPGAMSDKDREFLVSIVPGLAKTPQGNALIIETGLALAKRDQEVAKLARDYRKKHGELNEGFYDELQAFSEANPLFSKYTGATNTAGDRPSLDSFNK